jgi:hypothetical protein
MGLPGNFGSCARDATAIRTEQTATPIIPKIRILFLLIDVPSFHSLCTFFVFRDTDIVLPESSLQGDGLHGTDLDALMAYQALIDIQDKGLSFLGIEIDRQGRADLRAFFTSDA